jgi:hypothetical protein
MWKQSRIINNSRDRRKPSSSIAAIAAIVNQDFFRYRSWEFDKISGNKTFGYYKDTKGI